MVTWSDDVNLERICEGINKYISGYKMKDYYIFGLQQADRPHVRISPACPQSLVDLFAKSGYALEVRDTNEKYCGSCDSTHVSGNCHCDGAGCDYCDATIVSIGLRHDVRNDIVACRKLVKTIIFAVEEKLILNKDSKLKLKRVSRIVTKPKKEEQEKGLGQEVVLSAE